MSQPAITFRLAPEVRLSSGRAVGFLEGHRELNAADTLDGLVEKQKREMRTYMGEWISGKDKPESRFHGWPNDKECKMCFVFKGKEGNVNHRFYGFLCHPLPNSNPGFRLCVLCIYASKNERKSDRTELMRVRQWSESEEAKEAIAKVFPDRPKTQPVARKQQWKM